MSNESEKREGFFSRIWDADVFDFDFGEQAPVEPAPVEVKAAKPAKRKQPDVAKQLGDRLDKLDAKLDKLASDAGSVEVGTGGSGESPDDAQPDEAKKGAPTRQQDEAEDEDGAES